MLRVASGGQEVQEEREGQEGLYVYRPLPVRVPPRVGRVGEKGVRGPVGGRSGREDRKDGEGVGVGTDPRALMVRKVRGAVPAFRAPPGRGVPGLVHRGLPVPEVPAGSRAQEVLSATPGRPHLLSYDHRHVDVG